MNKIAITPPNSRKDSFFVSTYRSQLFTWTLSIFLVASFFPLVQIAISFVESSNATHVYGLWLISTLSLFLYLTLNLTTKFDQKIQLTRIFFALNIFMVILNLRDFAYLVGTSVMLLTLLFIYYRSPIDFGFKDTWLNRILRNFRVIVDICRSERVIFSPPVMIMVVLGFITILSPVTSDAINILVYLWFVLFSVFLSIACGFSNLFSNLNAFYRSILQPIRHDRLRDLASPFVTTSNILDLIRNGLLRFVSSRYTHLVGIFIWSILIVLWDGARVTQLYNEADAAARQISDVPQALDLIILGLVNASVLSTIYMIIWIFYNRSRYITIPFEVIGEENHSPELQAIANLTTQNLVIELQRISSLLRVRQVENLNLDEEGNNAFFVTSGNDQEFFEQLNQVMNLEIPHQGRFSISSLTFLILRLLAKIRIQGKVQRRTNGSIEIWTQLVYSNRQSVSVKHVFIPERFIGEINDISIRPIARDLAIELLFELGHIAHLGTSVATVHNMLSGFEASIIRNWWSAISFYKKAIHDEETLNNQFGLGHYHLGVALLFQGSWQQGLEHLRTAERDGTLIAELQYMIALVLLFIHWGELHMNPNVFQEIETRLITAVDLRRQFPEAIHLLGVTYYRRGRLKERWITRWYRAPDYAENERFNILFKNYTDDFQIAIRHYRQALTQYRRIVNGSQLSTTLQNDSRVESVNSSQLNQLLILPHLLADALRVREKYNEAIQLYLDSAVAAPRNLRNMADLAKTLCLGGRWQDAEEFLWRRAFIDDTAYWNADICLHMGWALAGGVSDELRNETLNEIIRRNFVKDISIQNFDRCNVMGEAMQFIDFALHQRPRYIVYYNQTNWFSPFVDALRIPTNAETTTKILSFPFRDKDEQVIKLKRLRIWLAYRIETYDLFEGDIVIDPAWKSDADQIKQMLMDRDKTQREYKGYYQYLNDLKRLRRDTIDFLYIIQNSKRNGGLHRTLHRITLGHELYEIWLKAKEEWLTHYVSISEQSTLGNCRCPDLLDRIVIDILLELALLSAKLLAESRAYEHLFEVAIESCKITTKWVEWWQGCYKYNPNYNSNIDFIFNARVFRYQQASLHAWAAYAKYHCKYDELTQARMAAGQKFCEQGNLDENLESYSQLVKRIAEIVQDETSLLDSLQDDLSNARNHIFYHPLVMYMEAQVLRKRGMPEQAVKVYEQIIDLIAPYDPKQHIGAEEFGDYAPTVQEPHPLKHKRTYLYFMERVCGRQQFYTLIDRSRIHMDIADTFAELGKPDLRVEHLREAIRWSPHDDQDIDNLIRLANELNNIERYDEALAVVDAIQTPLLRLGKSQPSLTKKQTPELLKCIILTRSGRYSDAIKLAKQVAREMILTSDQVTFVSPEPVKQVREGRIKSQQLEEKLNKIAENTQSLLDEAIFHTSETNVENRFNDLKPEFEDLNIKTIQEIVRKLNLNETFLNKLTELKRSEANHKVEQDISLLKFLSILVLDEKYRHPDSNPSTYANVQDSHLHLFKVFKKLKEKQLKDIDRAARTSQFVASQWFRESILSRLGTSEDCKSAIDLIVYSQVLSYISLEASKALSQVAELCNVLAYCRAQSGLHLQHAFIDSSCAVGINAFILSIYSHNTRARRSLEGKMAQFCDTFAWVRFRYAFRLEYPEFEQYTLAHEGQGDDAEEKSGKQPLSITSTSNALPFDLNCLEFAEEYLRRGLRYDQQRSIIYYHLARIYLARLEIVLQTHPEIVDPKRGAEILSYIDLSLNQVIQQHRFSKRTDRFSRLHMELAWVYNRIMGYKLAWETRKYRSLAGDSKVEPNQYIGDISDL